MQHKVLFKYLCLESCAEKNKNSKLKAFSLAEMLVVLLIMSFIAIGVPAIHFKKTEMKTKRSLHGRYECYYEGTTLMQYTVNEEGAATGPTAVTECKFTPPRNAIFFLVHAVGGGGGASGTTGSVSVSARNETNTYTSPNDFPDWMKDAQGAGLLPRNTTSYTGTRAGNVANITYGKSGNAGKTMSMFFPRLSNVEITMRPGRGGNLGGSGGTTTVDFNSNRIMTAAGGSGGSGSATYTVWLDGANAMCPLKELAGRKFNEADFASNIEMDIGTKMISKMQEALAGSGGAGGYGNVTATYNVSYTVNGTNVAAGVKRPTCDNPTQCDDGTVRATCPAQTGRNGAVVILW